MQRLNIFWKGFLPLLFVLCLFSFSCKKAALEKVFPAGGSAQKLNSGASASIKQYYLYLPKDYYTSNKTYPVIFFFHGGAQIGNPDPNVLTEVGVPLHALTTGDFPFIVIAPLLTSDVNNWVISDMDKMYNEVLGLYRMDLSRINVSGFSLGGSAAWIWASSNPNRFASINPIGCYADDNVCNVKNTPVWDFHNRYDMVFHLEIIQKSIDDLKACGGNVKFTIYDDGGHEGWTKAYKDPALYDWIAAQKRNN